MNQIIIDEQTIAHIKYEILGRSMYMILRYNDSFNCKIYYRYVRHNVINIFIEMTIINAKLPYILKARENIFSYILLYVLIHPAFLTIV